MPVEIIDLTGSPPPPPSRSSPRILNFAAANSVEHVQFGNLAMPLWPNNNPNPNNLPYTNQQHPTMWRPSSGNAYESTQLHIHHSIETQTHKILTAPSVWPASAGHTYEPSQTAISFQPHMHGDQVTVVLEPVAEANAYLFPHGTRLRQTWTPREHELFLMGLIKYGRGRWTKIARHFLSNKTPQQVQSYANSYFRNLPSTHLYSFRRRNSTYSTASFLAAGNNLNGGASSASSYNVPNLLVTDANNNNNNNDYNEPIKKTLMLFPEKLEPSNFFQVQPLIGEASTSTSTTTTTTTNNNKNYACYGSFQMQTIGAATTSSMNASGNYGEVDLELRLGRSQ